MNNETERLARAIEALMYPALRLHPNEREHVRRAAEHMRALQAELDSTEAQIEQLNASWTSKGCRYERRIAELEKKLAIFKTAAAGDIDRILELEKAVKAVNDLINESYGVAGLHLNGDVAYWDELLAGGRFEEWLCALSEVRDD